MGTDGCGLYGTDGIDEQLALMNLLKVSDEQFKDMKKTEEIIKRSHKAFAFKSKQLEKKLQDKSIEQYYSEQFENATIEHEVKFEINKVPSYPIFKDRIKIALGCFNHHCCLKFHY